MDGLFDFQMDWENVPKVFVVTCLSTHPIFFIALTVHICISIDLHPASDNSVTHVTIPVAAEAPIEILGASRHQWSQFEE